MKRVRMAVCFGGMIFCSSMSMSMHLNPISEIFLRGCGDPEGFQKLEKKDLTQEAAKANNVASELLDRKFQEGKPLFLFVGLHQHKMNEYYEGEEIPELRLEDNEIFTCALEEGGPSINSHVQIDLRDGNWVAASRFPSRFARIAFGSCTIRYMGIEAFQNLFGAMALGGEMFIQIESLGELFDESCEAEYIIENKGEMTKYYGEEILCSPIRRIRIRENDFETKGGNGMPCYEHCYEHFLPNHFPDSIKALADNRFPGQFAVKVVYFTEELDCLLIESCSYGKIPCEQSSWGAFVKGWFPAENERVSSVFDKCVTFNREEGPTVKYFTPPRIGGFEAAPEAAIVVRRINTSPSK